METQLCYKLMWSMTIWRLEVVLRTRLSQVQRPNYLMWDWPQFPQTQFFIGWKHFLLLQVMKSQESSSTPMPPFYWFTALQRTVSSQFSMLQLAVFSRHEATVQAAIKTLITTLDQWLSVPVPIQWHMFYLIIKRVHQLQLATEPIYLNLTPLSFLLHLYGGNNR